MSPVLISVLIGIAVFIAVVVACEWQALRVKREAREWLARMQRPGSHWERFP